MKNLVFVLCLLLLSCEDKKPPQGLSGNHVNNIRDFETSPRPNLKLEGAASFYTEHDEMVVVLYDTEKKVTCYVLSGGTGRGGIFCLRDEVATPK